MWQGTQTITTITLVIRTKSQRAPPRCPVGFRPHKNPGRSNHDIPKKCNFSNKQMTMTMRKNKACVSYSERIDGGEWVHGKAGDWQTCDGKVKHILITRARFCSQLSWSQEEAWYQLLLKSLCWSVMFSNVCVFTFLTQVQCYVLPWYDPGNF